jgi:hypothetical protein
VSYGFRVSSAGGQLGWIHWRNKIPLDVLPAWMRAYSRDYEGLISWQSPLTEQAYAELVAISEELGFYG